MTYTVTIEGKADSFPCAEDVNVLAGMEKTLCRAIPVGCRNGGCGACKIRIVPGRYVTQKMNRAVVSQQEEQEGCVLACKTFARDNISVQVLGRVWQPASHFTSKASFRFGLAESAVVSQPDKEN